jgi:hypothetical protein
MPAVSREAQARRKEYARKAAFQHYHRRKLVEIAREEQELQRAIAHAKATSQPRYAIILLYEKLERAQEAIKSHAQAVRDNKARTYTRNRDIFFSPELEAIIQEARNPELAQLADQTVVEDSVKENPELEEILKQLEAGIDAKDLKIPDWMQRGENK